MSLSSKYRLLSSRRSVWLLGFFLLLAFLLRAYGAGNQDMLGDEAADAFRAIGYIDYLGTNFQTQPIDWYKDQAILPLWTKLSFHDFPPLAMVMQHIGILLFGDSILGARMMSIILGTLSVWLAYAIGRRLSGEAAGIGAAAFFAVSGVATWIFRTTLLEPFLIFFVLLHALVFLKFLEDRRWWWAAGMTLGLVGLTKYTGIFIVPVLLAYASLYRRGIYKDWRLYAACGIAVACLAPAITYNIFLYKATGHFDLQIAYLLGEKTPEWQGLVGKTQDPFRAFSSNAEAAYGVTSLAVAVAAIAYAAGEAALRKSKAAIFALLYIFFVTLLLVKIGSAQRFLSLYVPGIAVGAGLLVSWLWTCGRNVYAKYGFRLCAGALLAVELVAGINKNLIAYPDYGVAGLDNYFQQELQGKESAAIPQSNNPHLNKVIADFAGKRPAGPRVPFVIVYNDDIALPTLEWVFYRRFFYHAMPAMFVENFRKTLADNGPDYFKGFTVYFVQSTEHTLRNPFKLEKTAGAEMEGMLVRAGIRTDRVISGSGVPMFNVYKFVL